MIALLFSIVLAVDPLPPTTALGVSALPPSINLDQYLEPAKPPVPCTDDMTTFEPSPVPLDGEVNVPYLDRSGRKTSWILRPGILVSECGFVEIINTASEHKWLLREIGVLRQLRIKEFELWRQVEGQYQVNILRLEQELEDAKVPTLWDSWKAPIMYGLGIATAVGVMAGTAALVNAAGSR